MIGRSEEHNLPTTVRRLVDVMYDPLSAPQRQFLLRRASEFLDNMHLLRSSELGWQCLNKEMFSDLAAAADKIKPAALARERASSDTRAATQSTGLF
jgi:hypothetical protein